MKLCSRLNSFLSIFFSEKNKCGYLNHIFGKFGMKHYLGWWFVGKSMVNFLFALIELFFAIYYGSRVELCMCMNCVQLGCFQRGPPLCTQILPGRSRPPSTILGTRKLKHWATRWWRPHPSAFPRFDTMWECDGRTDRQTHGRICRSIYSSVIKFMIRLTCSFQCSCPSMCVMFRSEDIGRPQNHLLFDNFAT